MKNLKKRKKYLFIICAFYLLLSLHFFQENFILDFCETKLPFDINLTSNFLKTQCRLKVFDSIEQITINNFSSAVYFCPEDDCKGILINLSKKSEQIKCMLYDLKLEPFIKQLEEKDTLLFLDESNKKHFDEYADKKKWNNDFKTDSDKSESHLMHNKFCIFDEEVIFTGSLNPTENGVFRNDNNLVVIESKEISKEYLKKFDELWNNKKPSNKNNNFIINNLNKSSFFNIYFCPEDNCDEKVLDVLKKAKKSVKFMTFSFTDDVIGDMLVDLNISVYGIFESKGTTTKYSEYSKLKEKYLGVLKDENKYNMHHKFFIIDNSILITGSYNPTWNGANRNDENIIITDYPDLVDEFIYYFDGYYGLK